MDNTKTPSPYGYMDYSKDPNGVRISGTPPVTTTAATTPTAPTQTNPTGTVTNSSGVVAVKPVTPLPVPKYGETITAGYPTGQSGTAQYDPNTGEKLAQPTDTTKTDTTQKTDTTVSLADQADRDALKIAQEEQQKAAKTFADTIMNIQNGVTPLSAGEQAQVDGLKQQFDQLIAQQKLTNEGASGIANVRGYQTGSAEYDPSFQTRTIASIVSAGQTKVLDLQIKEASAVATLTQAFRDKDMEAVKTSYDALKTASKERQDALQKTIDETTAAIKEANDKQQKVTDNINEIAKDAAKNGADSATINKITATGSVSAAMAMAGDYLQSASGELGDYLQYKRETLAKGLTPMLYGAYQDQQEAKKASREASKAYSSAYQSAAGRLAAENAAAGGGTGGVGAKFGATIEQATDFEPAKTQGAYKKQLQSLIDKGDYKSAILKIQNSVSKALTGDNKTQFDSKVSALPAIDDLSAKLQAYADAGGDTGLLKGTAEKIASKLGEVKDPAFKALATDLRISLQKYRHDMSGAAFSAQEAADYASVNPSGNNKLDLNLAILEGMKDNFQRQVDSAVESKVGEGAKYIKEFANAKQNVDSFVASHPDKAEVVAKLYEVPGVTDADVLEFLYLQ